jgi:hypothetical protein
MNPTTTHHPSTIPSRTKENQSPTVSNTVHDNKPQNQNHSQTSQSMRNTLIIVATIAISGVAMLILALMRQFKYYRRMKASNHPIVGWPTSNHPIIDWPTSPHPTVDWPSSNQIPTADWPVKQEQKIFNQEGKLASRPLSIDNGLQSPGLKTILWPAMRSP